MTEPTRRPKNAPSVRIVCVALLIALLPALLPRLRHPLPKLKLDDFYVYYTGSLLVRQHQGAGLYSGADTGVDPQKKSAPVGSPIEVASRPLGIKDIQLYVYPPTLADMLLPLTYIGPDNALRVWLAINVLLLLLTALCIVSLLRLRAWSAGAVLIFVCLFSFNPVLNSFVWGQILIFLLFLWAFGCWLYARGHVRWSGVVFALAAAIKLIPVLVVAPFLIWREWKWVQAFAVALVLCFAATLYLNTPAALPVYFRHVVPAMSRGLAEIGNHSVVSAVQLSYAVIHGQAVLPVAIVPTVAIMVAKVISLAVLASAYVLILRAGRKLSVEERIMTVGLLGMLASVISPVSWLHAYSTAFVALALLWGEMVKEPTTYTDLALLTLVSLMIGTFVPQTIVLRLAVGQHHAAAVALLLLEMGVVVAVITRRIARMPALQASPIL